jgi:hypothetical protein
MSVIEYTRKLLQDFLAPELRELSVRIDALEERMQARFDALEKGMDARFREVEAGFREVEAGFREVDTRFKGIDAKFDSAERLASERHAQTMLAIGRLADVYELRERVTRIEARERAS